jgi:hypothetical protein
MKEMLEAALLRELNHTWREISGNHFRAKLRPPVLALHDSSGRLGFWDHRSRTLSLARTLVYNQPWGVVREVLKHEIAHQFVDEVMGIRDESAHGPAFENLCRQHGFDPTARGLPQHGGEEGNPVLRRIARLLALAESPNLHEAEAAMKTAQRLMLKHNIDQTVALAQESFTFRHLGQPSGRIEAAEHVLAGILSRHFFVEVIWVPHYVASEGRRGRVLEICGTLSNLEVAAYVHGFLLETAERLWREHKRQHGIASNRERRRFMVGVMMGFDEKLKAGVAESRREGLVWVGDPALGGYIHQRYPRTSRGSGIGLHRTEAYEHGRKAGQSIVLHRPVSASAKRGHLLGPIR